MKILDTILIDAGLPPKDVGSERKNVMYFRPYKDNTLVGRVLREIWFRLGLKESVWYSRKMLKYKTKSVRVYDCLITVSYLEWLKKQFPDTQIVFEYCNLAGRAKHILPDQIPAGIVKMTYDNGDAQKYGMEMVVAKFSPTILREKQPIEYDVFYVGADKGRGEYILGLKDEMEKQGLKTKMIITADGRLSKKKPYYSDRISYDEVLDYDSKSKAIMNIVLPGQMGATLRDYEAAFLKCKLITNNPHIKIHDIYKKENVFIIGEDDFSKLKEFIDSPFVEIDKEIIERHLN